MGKQGFSGGAGFILAASGAAVGLGNIWSFPRYMAQGEGLLFLAIYMALAALVGYPLLMAEFAVGRSTRKKPRGAFRAICGHAAGGALGELASLLMMGFYSVLGGCCLRYMVINLAAAVRGGGTGGLGLFLSYISDIPLSAFCTVLFILMSCVIVMAGVSRGLERFSRVAMPMLVMMLPLLILASLSLPGAGAGLRAMFSMPERVTLETFAVTFGQAGAQMFFSLSLGLGCMLTYGAYLPSGASIPRCAAAVVIADTAIALLAGLAVLPAAHAGGAAPAEGPMLLFVTMQSVFDALGAWGAMFGFLFYLLVLLAALTSSVSLLEVISSAAGEHAGRKTGAVFAAALSAIPAVAIARDGMGFGALPEIFGLSWLDAAELISEGLLMPLCSLALAFALRPEQGRELLCRELGNRTGGLTRLAVKYLSPPLTAAVMAVQLARLV